MPLNPAALISKLTSIFVKADINQDGQLSKFELGSKLDLNALQTLIATMHVTFDADGDGIIDVHEMLSVLDADGDGQVSLQEFLDTFTEIYRLQSTDLSVVKGAKRGNSSPGRKGRGSFSKSLSSVSLGKIFFGCKGVPKTCHWLTAVRTQQDPLSSLCCTNLRIVP